MTNENSPPIKRIEYSKLEMSDLISSDQLNLWEIVDFGLI